MREDSAYFDAIAGSIDLSLPAPEKEPQDAISCNEFVVKLNAPAIVYNEYGMYSTDEKVLLNYIEEKAGTKLEIIKRFLSYDTIGGYQTTWELHKPVLAVFDKGTTLVVRTKDGCDIDISALEHIHIGERMNEGYGELAVYPVPKEYHKTVNKVNRKLPKTENAEGVNETGNLIEDIATTRAKEYIKSLARAMVQNMRKNAKIDENMKAVSANMTLMWEENDTFEGFNQNIAARFEKSTERKRTKLDLARRIVPKDFRIEDILCKVKEVYPEAKLNRLSRQYFSETHPDEDVVYKIYIKTLLLSIKYEIREKGEKR